MAEIASSSSSSSVANPAKSSSTPSARSGARSAELKALDRTVDRILNANLPPAPYITSVDGSIFSGRSIGHQWTRNSPFAPEEGHLQYQTLYFRDTSSSLLRLRAAHEDEAWRSEMAMRANGATVPLTSTKSGANTPLNASATAKKKISFNDYKSRKEAGSQASTPKEHNQPATDLRKETLKRELETSTDQMSGPESSAHLDTRAVNDETSEPRHPTTESKPDSSPRSGSNKRAADDVSAQEQTKSAHSPAKRIRITPPPDPPADTANLSNHNSIELLESEAAKTPEILVSTASPTHLSPNVDVSQNFAAQISLEREASPKRAAHGSESASTRRPKSSTDVIQDHADHDRDKHRGSKENESSDVKKKVHGAADASSQKATELPKPPGRPTLSVSHVSPKDKGLCSWFPRMATHYQDENGSWIPLRASPAFENRTPPPLSSLSLNKPSKARNNLSSTKPSTLLHGASSIHSASTLNKGGNKVANADHPKPTSPPSHSKQHSRPVVKTKESGNTAKQLDNKALGQNSKAPPKPHPAPDKANGALKPAKAAETSGPSTTFFKQYDADRKSAGSRTSLAIAARKEAGETMIVKLKFKRLAKDGEWLRRIKSAPRKETSVSIEGGPSQIHSSSTINQPKHERHSSAEQSKLVKSGNGSGSLADAMPRKRSPDAERSPLQPAEKRPKTTVDAHASNPPRTPSKQHLLSPARVTPGNSVRHVSPSSARNPKYANQDTPTQQVDATSPHYSGHSERHAHGSRSTSDPAQELSPQDYKAEFEKQQGIARALRKKMLAAFKSTGKSESGNSETKKIAAVAGVESVLCFMKAFAAQDRYSRDRNSSVKRWESLLPWLAEVTRSCDGFAHLQGISLVLRCVCCAELGTAFTRANSSESTSSSPTASSTTLKGVLDNFTNLRRYALDSERLLPRATMESTYPDAYKECSLLPLGMTMNTAIAIKVGYKFLAEWTAQEKIAWAQQLDSNVGAAN